jgi:hypothetical protein
MKKLLSIIMFFSTFLLFAEDPITIRNEEYWRNQNSHKLIDQEEIIGKIQVNSLRYEYFPIDKYYDENRNEEIGLWIQGFINADQNWFQGVNFLNPIDYAMRKNDIELFNKMILICQNYINTPDHTGMGGSGSIIWEAVGLDNEIFVTELFAHGLLLNNDELYIDEKDHYLSNILTVAKSKKIQKILVKNGVNEISSEKWDSYCLDDNVRIRKANSIDSEIITRVAKGTKFQVLGYTFIKYVLPDTTIGRWVKIEINGKIAWIWSRYVYKYYNAQ